MQMVFQLPYCQQWYSEGLTVTRLRSDGGLFTFNINNLQRDWRAFILNFDISQFVQHQDTFKYNTTLQQVRGY